MAMETSMCYLPLVMTTLLRGEFEADVQCKVHSCLRIYMCAHVTEILTTTLDTLSTRYASNLGTAPTPAPTASFPPTVSSVPTSSVPTSLPTPAPSEDCKGMAGFYLLSMACEVILVPYPLPTAALLHQLLILRSLARPARGQTPRPTSGFSTARGAKGARRRTPLPRARRIRALFAPLVCSSAACL